MAITPFKVIQGHQFLNPICGFLLVINYIVSHAVYKLSQIIGQICGFDKKESVFNTLVLGEFLNSRSQNLTLKNLETSRCRTVLIYWQTIIISFCHKSCVWQTDGQKGDRNTLRMHSQSNIENLRCTFTALYGMQTRSSDKNSVCLSVRPSVCPSVTRVNCDKTVERSVQIFIPYERSFSLVFWEEEWLVVGDPFCLKFWVDRPPLEQNRRFWTDNRS